ncbi:hypothetical protein [Dechloromonas denitrificans]|uniref:hypothetical protein n=1 Tax=Dechloromonas denitrificans TaxID=281362 RepID=UPI001CFB34ED|nr:hypothetical protein [Dechloromonas denitrificans]UCV09148.1 hypothetical protein KI615_06365 [Dechloromonas denitrificans]
MIQYNEPFIIMTRAELDTIIQQAAKAAALETLKHIQATTAHIRPLAVTQAEAARMLKKSRPTIGNMVKAGTFRLNKLGQIPIEQIDNALKAN